MNLFGKRRKGAALLRQLDRQRDLILRGKFVETAKQSDPLGRLAEELERALRTASAEDARQLEPIRAAAERNLALLDASRNGVAAAQRKLSAITAQRQSLNTYTMSGKRQVLSSGSPRLEKRS